VLTLHCKPRLENWEVSSDALLFNRRLPYLTTVIVGYPRALTSCQLQSHLTNTPPNPHQRPINPIHRILLRYFNTPDLILQLLHPLFSLAVIIAPLRPRLASVNPHNILIPPWNNINNLPQDTRQCTCTRHSTSTTDATRPQAQRRRRRTKR
jgi:hypothetical protein